MRRDISFRIGRLNSIGPQNLVRVSQVNESLELSDSMKEMKTGNGDRGQEYGQEGEESTAKTQVSGEE